MMWTLRHHRGRDDWEAAVAVAVDVVDPGALPAEQVDGLRRGSPNLDTAHRIARTNQEPITTGTKEGCTSGTKEDCKHHDQTRVCRGALS